MRCGSVDPIRQTKIYGVYEEIDGIIPLYHGLFPRKDGGVLTRKNFNI